MGVELRYNEFADNIIVEGLPGFGPILQDAGVLRLWITSRERDKLKCGKQFFEMWSTDFARHHSYPPGAGISRRAEVGGVPRASTRG